MSAPAEAMRSSSKSRDNQPSKLIAIPHTPPAGRPLQAPPLWTVATDMQHAIRILDVPHGSDGENGCLPRNESADQIDILGARAGRANVIKIDDGGVAEDDNAHRDV